MITHSIFSLVLNTTPINTIFGGPVRPPGPNFLNPIEGISVVMVFGIRMALISGMVTVLTFLLWGAYDWITGGGEQEKLDKARSKITNAVLGMILMVFAIGLFSVVSGDILGLIKRDATGNWVFSLPTIGGSCIRAGLACTPGGTTSCCTPLSCTTAPPPGTGNVCQ